MLCKIMTASFACAYSKVVLIRWKISVETIPKKFLKDLPEGAIGLAEAFIFRRQISVRDAPFQPRDPKENWLNVLSNPVPNVMQRA